MLDQSVLDFKFDRFRIAHAAVEDYHVSFQGSVLFIKFPDVQMMQTCDPVQQMIAAAPINTATEPWASTML